MGRILAFIGVLVTGALLGGFFGKFLGMAFPSGRIHELFAGEITAGLHPTHIDLHLVDLTFGCLFRFNMFSLIGVIVAALLFKIVLK